MSAVSEVRSTFDALVGRLVTLLIASVSRSADRWGDLGDALDSALGEAERLESAWYEGASLSAQDARELRRLSGQVLRSLGPLGLSAFGARLAVCRAAGLGWEPLAKELRRLQDLREWSVSAPGGGVGKLTLGFQIGRENGDPRERARFGGVPLDVALVEFERANPHLLGGSVHVEDLEGWAPGVGWAAESDSEPEAPQDPECQRRESGDWTVVHNVRQYGDKLKIGDSESPSLCAKTIIALPLFLSRALGDPIGKHELKARGISRPSDVVSEIERTFEPHGFTMTRGKKGRPGYRLKGPEG